MARASIPAGDRDSLPTPRISLSRETKHPLERASRRFDRLKTADVKVEQAESTCCLLLNIARAF
jgi:hypothetical protein